MDDLGVSLTTCLHDLGRRARAAAEALAAASADSRTLALKDASAALREQTDAILRANAADLASAEALSPSLRDRLTLTPGRIDAMADGVAAIAAIEDPVGVELERWRRPNGLDIARISAPIGVLAMIYEARPGVTADAAALCLRSGNAVILRPGRECLRSALAIHQAMSAGVVSAGLPADAVQVVPTADREAVALLLEGLGGAVDLLIPRGGRGLVERVEREARVPVLGHREGLNHTFVHAAADPKKALEIVLNAKMRRVSVCGATETLLVDKDALVLLPSIAAALTAAGCELRGDSAACAAAPGMRPASDADFRTEHLAAVLSVAVVDGLDGALAHIKTFGTGHTEAIVTEDRAASERFLRQVDAAIVLVNASTQFADGGEFGFGGEIGIATGRLHARGPVGARQLTTFKYVVRGTGQTRP